MQELTRNDLVSIEGGLEEGTACGLFVGATIGAGFLFGPLAGALVFMVTPLACVLDFGLHK